MCARVLSAASTHASLANGMERNKTFEVVLRRFTGFQTTVQMTFSMASVVLKYKGADVSSQEYSVSRTDRAGFEDVLDLLLLQIKRDAKRYGMNEYSGWNEQSPTDNTITVSRQEVTNGRSGPGARVLTLDLDQDWELTFKRCVKALRYMQ